MQQMEYVAHATMRNGFARQVSVSAADAVEARRKLFALYRSLASLTNPKPLICASLMALAACGGGGDDEPPVNTDSTVLPINCAASGACQ